MIFIPNLWNTKQLKQGSWNFFGFWSVYPIYDSELRFMGNHEHHWNHMKAVWIYGWGALFYDPVLQMCLSQVWFIWLPIVGVPSLKPNHVSCDNQVVAWPVLPGHHKSVQSDLCTEAVYGEATIPTSHPFILLDQASNICPSVYYKLRSIYLHFH